MSWPEFEPFHVIPKAGGGGAHGPLYAEVIHIGCAAWPVGVPGRPTMLAPALLADGNEAALHEIVWQAMAHLDLKHREHVELELRALRGWSVGWSAGARGGVAIDLTGPGSKIGDRFEPDGVEPVRLSTLVEWALR